MLAALPLRYPYDTSMHGKMQSSQEWSRKGRQLAWRMSLSYSRGPLWSPIYRMPSIPSDFWLSRCFFPGIFCDENLVMMRVGFLNHTMPELNMQTKISKREITTRQTQCERSMIVLVELSQLAHLHLITFYLQLIHDQILVS